MEKEDAAEEEEEVDDEEEGAAGEEWKVKYCKEGELLVNTHILQHAFASSQQGYAQWQPR